CNFNSVPADPRKAFDPSGIRLGTPAVTTRGFKEPQMKLIAKWIAQVAENIENEEVIAKVRQESCELCTSGRFPVPGIEI
ncbi:MAG: serine hydroxymethyltransferase, partial [Halocynthiibacter sp.]